MLNLHYDCNTGAIVSYQEGPSRTPKSDIPEGCSLLCIPPISDLINRINGEPLYRVNPDTKELVLKRAIHYEEEAK